MQEYKGLAAHILEMAGNKVQAEVFIQDSQEMTIEVANYEVENLKLAQERGVGLRVVADRRLGYAYSSDLSPGALQKMVQQAIHNAGQSEPDPDWELPGPQDYGQDMNLYDEETFRAPVEEKIELARQIERSAREYDARVKITEKAVYNEAKYQAVICNNRGLSASYRGSYCGGFGVVVGQEQGDSQMGFGLQYELKYKKLDPARIGREAGQKAVRMLGARPITSGLMPIVLDPYTVTGFLGVLQGAFSAEAVLKGKSFLRGKEGQPVASPLLNISDNGVLKGRLGSTPFDGEGVRTGETRLIENGRLIGFLHSYYTARKFDVKPTGNGVRSSYKGTPEVGITNFYVAAGQTSKESLLQNIDRGLYITDVMGMHTANPVSGDFSVGAAGLLIEKGRLTRPVKGVAVAGNIKELLMKVEAVGDDLTFFVGKGAPSLLISEISVSGS